MGRREDVDIQNKVLFELFLLLLFDIGRPLHGRIETLHTHNTHTHRINR